MAGNDPWIGTTAFSEHFAMPPAPARVEEPPLFFVPLPAHRPAGPWQGTIPKSVEIRSDFLSAVSAALQAVSDLGAALPLLSTIPPLPPVGSRASSGEDMLRFLGRVIHVAPATALVDAEADPILLARPRGSADPWMVMARVLMPLGGRVPRYNWDALECDASSYRTVAIDTTALVAIEPILGHIGFHRQAPAPVPTSGIDPAWARFENHTGLHVGDTTLGDELRLFYDAETIAESIFNDRLDWVWDGETFT